MQDVNTRVQRHRAAMREAGFRLVQMWVPDTRQPGFDKACRQQARTAARADLREADLPAFLDAALDDLMATPEPGR